MGLHRITNLVALAWRCIKNVSKGHFSSQRCIFKGFWDICQCLNFKKLIICSAPFWVVHFEPLFLSQNYWEFSIWVKLLIEIHSLLAWKIKVLNPERSTSKWYLNNKSKLFVWNELVILTNEKQLNESLK